MKKGISFISLLLATLLVFGGSAAALDQSTFNEAYAATQAKLYAQGTPDIGSIGGDWIIIELARADYPMSQSYLDSYYNKAVKALQDSSGVLDSVKYTEYSRLILSLTAIGRDVTNVGGYNLLSYLSDFNKVKKQGLNGPIWALLALDSHDYAVPIDSAAAVQTSREGLISYILSKQTSDGGWALYGDKADCDMTGMAMQSLGRYYGSRSDVTAALDRGLACLSAMQEADGGFGTEMADGSSSESIAQVIVALCAMGINPESNADFIKNGYSPIDALYSYYDGAGGFRHVPSGETNGMATEQACYAMVAYRRLQSGKSFLYNMNDVVITPADNSAAEIAAVEAAINAIGTVNEQSAGAIISARSAYESLNAENRAKVSNLSVLERAEAEYNELISSRARVQAVEKRIAAIGTVNSESGAAISSARGMYDALSIAEKNSVSNYQVLTAAEAAYAELNASNLFSRGDISGDGVINSADLTALLSAYGTKAAKCDINADGIVNSQDLTILLSNYGSKN